MKTDYFKENAIKWANIHRDIFGKVIPDHYEWVNIEDIANVLNKIGSVKDSHHLFFPFGGGLDFSGAKALTEKGFIELDFDFIHLIRPKKLVYEKIDDGLEWSYFRIENLPLEPTGIYEDCNNDFVEEVLELTPGWYVDSAYWDCGSYNGMPLPGTARYIVRNLKGSMVIFKKASFYNHNPDTYDARHESLGAEGFKQHILAASRIVGNSG